MEIGWLWDNQVVCYFCLGKTASAPRAGGWILNMRAESKNGLMLMNIAGLCAICGRVATETCKGCGKGNCGREQCRTGFVCTECARGKQG